MTKVVTDSSVHISFYGHDSNSPYAIRFFNRFSNKIYFITPSLVIAETITILAKIPGLNLQLISQTLSNTEVVSLDSQFIKSLESYLINSPTPKLKTSDLIIALTAKLHNATLVTWDKQLLTQDICPATTPEKY